MAAKYPTSIVDFSNILTGTIFSASLLTELREEVEAIEAEIGSTLSGLVSPIFGSAGSLRERLANCMDGAGNILGRVKSMAAVDVDGGRRRCKAGYNEFTEKMAIASNAGFGKFSITFDVAFKNTPRMFPFLVDLSANPNRPVRINFDDATTTTFYFTVSPWSSVTDIPFGVMWFGIEGTQDTTDTSF
jgi:hypothetical protein